MVGHRLSIGGKSPLTGGVKESNAGGTTGLALTHLGIRDLIIEDKPATDAWQILHISAEGVNFDPAGDLVGLGVFETAPCLLEKYGKKVAIALIGPGGEMELRAAGIQNLDKDRIPSRIAARGGLGALMGSKRVKAIVIDFSGGARPDGIEPRHRRSGHGRPPELGSQRSGRREYLAGTGTRDPQAGA